MSARLLLLVALAAGCGSTPRRVTGILVLHVTPAEARVKLDDRVIGRAAELSGHPLRVNVGHRRLEISADGHYAARREADITPTGSVELDVRLHPVPDGEREE